MGELPAFHLDRGLGSTQTLNNGIAMPVFGLGVFQMARGRTTQQAVRAALDLGYRMIDTAALYGNEEDVGIAIRASGVPRDELFVTTKLWNDDQGYDSALRAFAKSRAALGGGPVDLYLVHWPVSGKRLESWRALTRLLKGGDCRAIGVSNFTIEHLNELAEHSDVVPAVNQVEFNPFLYQRDLLEFCRSCGIQLVGYAPIGRGRRLDDPRLAVIARRHWATPAQVMLRWGLEHGVIEIPKSTRPERIRENAGAMSVPLSPADMAELDRLDEGFRTSWDPSTMR